MARQLDTYEFQKPGRPCRYDWNNWANGEIWELALNTDYDDRAALVSSAKSYAYRNRLKCKIDQTVEGRVVLQFLRK